MLVRPVEVGVCGTDREISEGWFGIAPAGEERLILGHELLGRVEAGGHGFARGDLVTATVRRSCGHCASCAEGAPDACETGDYSEHGITRLHGFAAELAVVPAEHLVAVPEALGGVGVLAEPASICARALRHVRAVGGRQPWHPGRALVFGAGAIGMLCTYFLRLDGLEVWTSALEPPGSEKARLVEAAGARYVTGCRATRPTSTSSSRRPAARSSRSTRSACSAATASRACSGSTGTTRSSTCPGR